MATNLPHRTDASARTETVRPPGRSNWSEIGRRGTRVGMPMAERGRRGGLARAEHGVSALLRADRADSPTAKVFREKFLPEKIKVVRALVYEHGQRSPQVGDDLLIAQLAFNLAIADRLWSYILENGAIDLAGRPRGAMKSWNSVAKAITRQLTALGLNPRGRAALRV